MTPIDKKSDSRELWPRIILHADMDAFYAAVEQRDDPALRGKAMVIGGDSRRGVVSTASYEAREFGIKSAMPMVEALRRCPHVIVVRPDMARYVTASRQINQVFQNYSPKVEPLSLDEAFLDMTGAESIFGSPKEMALGLKKDVFEATGGLTVSVGVSSTKYVAKVASDFRKPDGYTVVPPSAVRSFLWPLPISRLWGAGEKTQQLLHRLGLNTIGDVARCSDTLLTQKLGTLGPFFKQLSLGIDDREVISHREAKSIGKEITLEQDIVGEDAIWPYLRRLADQVARSLRKKSVYAQGVRVKLKTAGFKILTRQKAIHPPTNNAREMLAVARPLLTQFDLNQPMRLVGITAFGLVDKRAPIQQELFGNEQRKKDRKLQAVIDQVLEKYGEGAVKRGSD